jgi:cytochrome c
MRPRLEKRLAVLAVLLCSSMTGCIDVDTPALPVRGADPTEAAQIDDGRMIAERNCMGCHAIGRIGPSPNPTAPPFRSVLNRYRADVLATELSEGIHVSHAPMPQFEFNPAATDSLIAYLRSIQTGEPGQALAEQRCARCHAIAETDTSPYPGAQPFRNLGRRWSQGQLRDALKTGIVVEHDKSDVRLPPMKLNDADIEAFLKYLDSIATRENPAPPPP